MIRAALILTLLAGPAMAQESFQGHVQVHDGDGIIFNGQMRRLHGIDAPELAQSLGNWSRDMLIDAIRGRELYCEWGDLDRYGRPLSTCYPILASGNVSTVPINRTMVRIGAAAAYLEYSDVYAREMHIAMRACRGIWKGLAWCYRRAGR